MGCERPLTTQSGRSRNRRNGYECSLPDDFNTALRTRAVHNAISAMCPEQTSTISSAIVGMQAGLLRIGDTK